MKRVVKFTSVVSVFCMAPLMSFDAPPPQQAMARGMVKLGMAAVATGIGCSYCCGAGCGICCCLVTAVACKSIFYALYERRSSAWPSDVEEPAVFVNSELGKAFLASLSSEDRSAYCSAMDKAREFWGTRMSNASKGELQRFISSMLSGGVVIFTDDLLPQIRRIMLCFCLSVLMNYDDPRPYGPGKNPLASAVRTAIVGEFKYLRQNGLLTDDQHWFLLLINAVYHNFYRTKSAKGALQELKDPKTR